MPTSTTGDAIRLAAARRVRDSALAKLEVEHGRLATLRCTDHLNVADVRLLSQRKVVAPLAQKLVSSEDRATQIVVSIQNLRIREKNVMDS